ncbi:MAG: hypothetical protein ACRD4S_13115 [Candidatus Acidiferrales bacterium]
MGSTGLVILILLIVAIFGAAIAFGILQSRWERRDTEKTANDEWRDSGFDAGGGENLRLYRIVPTSRMKVAEYVFQDDQRQELGRYLGYTMKRADIEYGGRKATLFIQGGAIGGSAYAGKVGGASRVSIVIRNESHVIAEVLRKNARPPIDYEMNFQRQIIAIRTGGWSPTSAGIIRRGDEVIGRFRRPRLAYRKILVALRGDLPDELKVCLCSIILLQ